MKYQCFLSHNSADKPVVEDLARRLEGQGISTFLDKWHLIPGEPWQPALEEALDHSNACVVFVGRSGLGPWQNEEMRGAINRRVNDRSRTFRVVPVLLPGALRTQRSKLPAFLVAATWVEFPETLDNEDSLHRLKCGILGRAPGPSPGEALYEGTCPYRGLRVFDVDNAQFFFGRDAQVDWLIERLNGNFGTVQESRFLAVVGASGSGKSSLVRAGLIPAMQAGYSRSGKRLTGSSEWPIVVLRPSSEPLKALADALWADPTSKSAISDPLALADRLLDDERRLHATIGTVLTGSDEGRRFVIVVDQFEELFTQCSLEHEKQRLSFIDNLLYAASVSGGKTIVFVTMRADFYGKCSQYEQLAHALSEEHELVPPLSNAELRAAIEQPAQLCGLELESGLVELLLQDMRKQPAGALPLLQQTLYMLWERRDGRRLSVQAYRDIGEIEGALEAHANRIYSEQLKTDEQREICRRVLLMLTSPGEGTEDTRRRVSRPQLGASESTDAVLQELVKGRLITISETEPPLVEVTHEALIRGWNVLREWLDEDREALRILHRISDAAEEWESHDCDPAFLYRGSRLVQAEAWAEEHPGELADVPSAQAFLDECVSQRDIDNKRREAEEHERIEMLEKLAAEAERRDREARAKVVQERTARRLTVALATTLLLAGLAVAWFQVEGRRQTGRALVEQLPEAETANVVEVINGLKTYRGTVESRLREMFAQDARPKAILHAALALEMLDPGVLEYREFLVARLLEAEARPDELRVIRTTIGKDARIPAEVEEQIQRIISHGRLESYTELNAVGALAGFAPGDERWARLGPLVAEKVCREPLLRIDKWSVVFGDVANSLLITLRGIYSNSGLDEQQRLGAYMLLFSYADPDEPDDVVELIGDANPEQFKELMARLQSHRSRAATRLAAKLDPPARFDSALARRQCRIAIALWLLGDVDSVSQVLKHSEDPTLRTELIHELSTFGVDVRLVIEQLFAEEDNSARCALILALGEFEQPDEELNEILLTWYRDADPGIHGAVHWLLHEKWGKSEELREINKELASRDPPPDRDWYVNRQGQTFTVVRDPPPFQMGSPSNLPMPNEKPRHWRRIGRSFAIATKEVTVAEYQRFLEEHDDVRNILKDSEVRRYISKDEVLIANAPMIAVKWYEAARYCNWLSQKEGIDDSQLCYKPNENGLYESEMTLTSADRKLGGYRLPTEAEWEFACRAGAQTRYPHGMIAARLRPYAQYVDNERVRETHLPVGLKKPNDLGLFDMLGSVGEWIDDTYQERYPTDETSMTDPINDSASGLIVLDGSKYPRTRRGGNLPLVPLLRSATRNGNRPEGGSQAVGFRVARTISTD